MNKKYDRSEEYKKGYNAGRQTKYTSIKPDLSRLINVCAIPPVIEWLQIDGDEEHHICSNCKTSFEWYEPFKFCPECGGRSEFADGCVNSKMRKRGEDMASKKIRGDRA